MYTKGKWKFEDEYVRAENGEIIADPYCMETAKTSRGNMEANARLIAAAPELLEACKNFFEWHANHFEEFSDEINGQLLCLANDAEAAIAKAESEAQ